MNALVSLRDVTKRYRSVTAVEGVSLELGAGEVVALVGHNGAGKTTLIKMMLGLIRPSEGAVTVLGADPADARGATARRGLGYLPENVAFHGAMTGRELMRFYAKLKGEPRDRNAELLARVGLEGASGRRVSTYSKGMRQRLGLAQALIGDPRLMLLDEPTSGLDPASRADVYDMIRALKADGATVLVSTHALREIEARADRVAVMHRGRLIALGTVPALRQQAAGDAVVTVKVRPCSTAEVLRRVPEGVRCLSRAEDRLALAVEGGRKMDLIRQLAAMTDLVHDVETETPDLEDVYRRLVRPTEEA
ncbi:ABC transporter ATP-binding protein [Faunimonas sp. B44]|uniref:ABC transporter ATP-binding protein n=1 Tax=Faunimonas sp. B44 TaxID=3461493 RepID=UPI004043E4F2